MVHREYIRKIMREEYERVYEEPPKRMDDKARIYTDVGAGSTDKAFALQWADGVMKRLDIDQSQVEKLRSDIDYTVGTLIDRLEKAPVLTN